MKGEGLDGGVSRGGCSEEEPLHSKTGILISVATLHHSLALFSIARKANSLLTSLVLYLYISIDAEADETSSVKNLIYGDSAL